DINECTATPPKCTGEDKRCVNYPGAYRCNCISPRQQLTKDGSACINVSASVRGKIQIINLPFIPAYSDTSSSEYFETTQRITSQLTRNYQETPTMRFFFHSVMMIRLL
ncbi:mucin isoform X1, partial [Paramuricea clavata]